MNGAFARWRANFYTGLAVVLPAVISIAIVKWLFGTVANVTDPLVFFFPRTWTHDPQGPMYWWWSVSALLLGILLISAIGRMTRHYVGKQLIQSIEHLLLRVPVLNKIYAAIKQVNEALTSSNKTSFKQVVLIEFPSHGIYSMGFITGAPPAEVQARTDSHLVSVFVPTTPNPTGGFVLLVPERQITRLEMSVADGVKYILSLGSVAPEFTPALKPPGDLPPPALLVPPSAVPGLPLKG